MSHAGQIIEDYFQRKGQPRDSALDAAYQFEMTMLRDMLSRLEVILDDEGVGPDTRERVIRCMLYGSPSPAAAEMRMRQEQEMVDLLNRTSLTVHVDGIHDGEFGQLLAETKRARRSAKPAGLRPGPIASMFLPDGGK
jgi:hypothetical protein